MKRSLVGVSNGYLFLRDDEEKKDICTFRVGDYVHIKALLKLEYTAYIEYIEITENRTNIGIHDVIYGIRDWIPVDTIETMEVLEKRR